MPSIASIWGDDYVLPDLEFIFEAAKQTRPNQMNDISTYEIHKPYLSE